MTLSLDDLLRHEFARQQRTLLLEDWVIRVVADEEKARDGEEGSGAPDGTLSALYSYREATFFYDPTRVREEQVEQVVTHELVHLMVEPLRDMVERLINDGRFTEKEKRLYAVWASEALEMTVTNVERRLRRRSRAGRPRSSH